MMPTLKQAKNRVLLSLGMAALLVTPALATDPDPGDYSTAVTATGTAIQSAMTDNSTAVFGILATGLVIGLVMRLVKRAAKSV